MTVYSPVPQKFQPWLPPSPDPCLVGPKLENLIQRVSSSETPLGRLQYLVLVRNAESHRHSPFAKSARAVKVLKECIRLKPDDATIPLLAAKLCVGSLHWVSAPEAFSFLWVERRQ